MYNSLIISNSDLNTWENIRGEHGSINVVDNLCTVIGAGYYDGRAYKRLIVKNVHKGETFVFKAKAFAVSGRGSMIIDYPAISRPKAGIVIDKPYWKDYTVEYTVSDKDIENGYCNFVIGCVTADLGEVKFTDVRVYVKNPKSERVTYEITNAFGFDGINILSPTEPQDYDWGNIGNSAFDFKLLASKYTVSPIGDNPFPDGGAGLTIPYRSSYSPYASQIMFNTTIKKVKFRIGSSKGWLSWSEFLHTANTIVDSNGFIKSASPILNLYTDKIEINNEDEFGATPVMQRLEKGVYEIKNTLGLRLDDGWYIETPNDRNGNKYFNIEWAQNIIPDAVVGVVDEYRDDIVVTIETFERVWNKDTGLFENGDPIDINDLQDRFVQLRFNEIKVEQEQEELDDSNK